MLQVESVPGIEIGSTIGVKARIDWKLVEQYQTLEELASADESLAVIVEPKPRKDKSKEGTEIRLERLRRSWSDKELLRFVSEVQSFSPSEFLINPTKEAIKPYSYLLQSPKISDVKDCPFCLQIARRLCNRRKLLAYICS